MKPHHLSDLLDALYKSINPGYGPGRQKEEFVRALEAAGIRPEHGNRGQELETMVLVDSEELRRLRISQLRRMADVCRERLGNWPRILSDVPPRYITVNSWRSRWCRRISALLAACLAETERLRGTK